MFCSRCRCVGNIRECRRKICPVGHIACESCDTQLEKCSVCGNKFSSFVSVQLDDLVPRLIFGPSISTLEQKLQSEELGNLKSTIECCEEQNAVEKAVKHPAAFEGFKGQRKLPNVMQFFEICEESSGLNPGTESFELPTELFEDFKFACKCDQHQTKNSRTLDSHPIDHQTATNSHDTVSTIGSDSVHEIFIKSCMLGEDSETASFISGTESEASSMVPSFPPKLGTPTVAHRVKFGPIFHAGGRIQVHIEPLNLHEYRLSEFSHHELPSDRSRKLSRFPVRCPIINCGNFSVPSDFCNHITIDHPQIDVLKVSPVKLINVSLNHKGQPNTMVCQRLLLVSDKLTDIGYGAFENFLPVLLMTSKLSVRKTFNCSEECLGDENFYIYLVGVYQFPLSYTIAVWAHDKDNFEPTIAKCMSSSVMFINNPPTSKDIVTKAFAISHLELKELTNDGKNRFSCQVLFN